MDNTNRSYTRTIKNSTLPKLKLRNSFGSLIIVGAKTLVSRKRAKFEQDTIFRQDVGNHLNWLRNIATNRSDGFDM